MRNSRERKSTSSRRLSAEGGGGEEGESAAGEQEKAQVGIVAFFRSINLRDYLADRYQRLKRRYDIDSREVVIFLPLLFLSVFLLRGLMSFIEESM